MKNVISFICIVIILINISVAQTNVIDSKTSKTNKQIVFTSSNLPIVFINTGGQIIPDDHKITADMGIIYNGEGLRNNLTDPFNNYNGKIGIEIRGSSSQQFPKKQYSVETRDLSGNDISVSLLGFPEESDWILFAPYNDKSLMRDVLVYKIASQMGRYASRSKYCEVVLDGEYIGLYVLLEKVKRDANRVNIKKLEPADISGDDLTGGYILKIDKTDGENNDGWYSTYLPNPLSPYSVFYQYHYPKPDEIVQQQKDYIQNKIFQFETMMNLGSNISDTSTGYPKYLDVNSFIDFILVNEMAKNVDGYRLSTYLYKDRDSRNTRIFAGPVWDFNLAFGNADYYNGWMTNGWQLEYLTTYQNIPLDEPFLTPFWWRKLFDDPDFRNNVYSRWQMLKNNVLTTQNIFNQIDSLKILLDESSIRNFEKWPVIGVRVWPNYFVGQTYQQEIDYLKNWISFRLNWMNLNMIGEPTNILNQDDFIITEFELNQNFPNPFNPTTRISWTSPKWSYQTLKVFDILGNEIKTLVDGYKPAGSYSIYFDASQLISGIYFYQLKSDNYSATKKMLLIK
ncbi:MAG: CotH kinase family protein [Ignavibacteriaceae bacterium]